MSMKKIATVIVCLIVVLIGFKLTYFQSTTIFGYDGVVITDEKVTENLLNVPNKTTGTLVKASNVNASDMIYSQNGNLFYGDNKKTKLLKGYPTFINDGKGLLTLDNSAVLLDQNFKEHDTYPNLILSDGALFQGVVNRRLDDNEYYFMKLNNGFLINSKEMNVKTNLHDYHFKINSIHNFTETSIQSYIPDGDSFKYQVLQDVDFGSTIEIGNAKMTYKEFLIKLGLYSDNKTDQTKEEDKKTDKEEDKKVNETIKPSAEQTPIKEPEVQRPDTANSTNNAQNGNDVQGNVEPTIPYVKPQVTVSEFLGIPYGFTSKLTVQDPDKHLRSSIVFNIYEGDDLILRKSFKTSSDLLFDGLKPDQEYRITGEYVYVNANKKQESDKFLDLKVKSGGISALHKVSLSGDVQNVLSDSFTLEQFKVTSDLKDAALSYVQTVEITANNIAFNIKNEDLIKLKKGEALAIQFPKLLSSNTDYSIQVHLYDRYKNEIPSTFEELNIHTPKKLPDINYSFVTKNIDEFDIKYKITDEDHLNPKDGVFQLYEYTEDEKVGKLVGEMKEADTKDDMIIFKNFAYSDYYILRYAATVDLNDGKGEQQQYTIKDFKVTNASLAQLGAIYVTTNVPTYKEADSYPTSDPYAPTIASYPYAIKKDTSYTASYDLDINRTSIKLLELMDSMKMDLYTKDEKGNKTIIHSDTYKKGDEIFDKIKNKASFTKDYDGLQPNTQYFIDFTGYYKGETIGISSTVNNFKTWKKMPTVGISNMIITQNDVLGEVSAEDFDKVSDNGKVMVVLQEWNDKAANVLLDGKAIDVAIVDVNKPRQKIRLHGIQQGKKYVLNYYMSDAVWSANSVPLKEKKVYLQSQIFDANGTINGKLDVQSIRDHKSDPAKLDIKLSTTLFDKNIGTGTYYVDIFKGDKKDDAHSYQKSYTLGSNIQDINVMTLPKEDAEYTAQLYVYSKAYGTRVDLSQTTFNTKSEIQSINSCDVLYGINGSSGRYKVTQDLDCSASPKTIQTFNGELDFDGHNLTYAYKGNDYLFNTIQKNAVIKNLHYTIVANNRESQKGIANTNYGTISNLSLQTVGSGTDKIPAWGRSELAFNNKGTIDTFTITMTDPNNNIQLGETNISMGVVNNSGIIRNGYVANGLLSVRLGGLSGNDRSAGAIAATNQNGGVIENIYALNAYEGNGTYKNTAKAANVVGVNNGTVRNIYSTQPPVNNVSAQGAAVGINYGKASNIYYIDNRLHDNKTNERISYAQLHSSEFQNKVLNSGNSEPFDIERYVDNGYFPQIKFNNENMPKQPLRSIPVITDKDKVSFIDSTVKVEPKDPTSYDYHGVVTLLLKNPYQYKIKSVSFDNLTAEVISQTDNKKTENSSVDVKVNVPKDGQFVDHHNLLSIVYEDNLGNTIPVNYPPSDARYDVNISFYNKVSSIDEWQRIRNFPNQNFEITQDIDFLNIENAALLNVNIAGKIKGNNHTLSNIKSTGYAYVISKLNGGSIQNVNFSDISINAPNAQQGGMIATVTSGLIDGVHVNNLTLSGGNKLGGIVGSLQGNIQNSSVSNSKIIMNRSDAGGLGGIAGAMDNTGGSIENSYVQDVTLTVAPNVTQSRAIGGIAGYTQNGSVNNVYAVTDINVPDGTNVGGIIGNLGGNFKTVVQGVYAKANIQASDYVGGLIGIDSQNGTEVAQNTFVSDTIQGFFTGDIKAKGRSGYVVGGYLKEKPTAMYVNQSTLLNNVATSDSSILIKDDDFKLAKTYTDTIGLGSTFVMNTDTTQAILPKLKGTDTDALLPNQKDNILQKKDFYLKSATIGKTSEFVTEGTLTLQLYNKNNYPIERVAFKDQMMTTQGDAVSTYDAATHITTYTIKVKPNYFVNSYNLDTIDYTDQGESKSIDAATSINAKFYRKISGVQDWPIDMGMHNYIENYHIVNDIDFAGKTISDINEFRRYFNNSVNDIVGDGHTIKNLTVSAPLIPEKDFLIKEVTGTVRDLNLENVSILYDYKGMVDSNSLQVRAGIFALNNGTIQNANVKNVDIKYRNVNSNISNMGMGIVAINGGKLSNINIDNASLSGTGTARLSNLGILAGIGRDGAVFDNIQIANSRMDVNTISAGGMVGRFNNSGKASNIRISNTNVKNNNSNTGGVIGQARISALSLSNLNLSNNSVEGKNNVGGVSGVSFNTNISGITADALTMKGTVSVGGMIGSLESGGTTNISNANMSTINVNGSENSSGGVIGNGGQPLVFNNLKGTDFTVISKNNFVGGLVGNQGNNGTVKNVEINGLTMSGNGNIGGMFGQTTGKSFTASGSYIRNILIKSTDARVGGILGHVNTGNSNINITNSGVQINSFVASTGNLGGMIGYMNSNNGSITIANSYVTGNNTRASIHANTNTGGMVGNAVASSRTNIKDSYVYASVKSDAGNAGMVLGSSGNVSVNGFLSIGDVTAGSNGAGGVIGQIYAGVTNVNINHALILADITMTNGDISLADQLIGRKYDTLPTFNKTYIYLGNKINNIAIKGNYESRYEDVDGLHLLDYTKLTDLTFYTADDGLALSNQWNSNRVNQGYAPFLNSAKYQFDIRMTVNQIRAAFRSGTFVYPALLPQVKYYTSDVDKINIEFNSKAAGLQFTIQQDGKEILKQDIHQSVYTLRYDFKSPFDIIVSNGHEKKTYTVDPHKISRSAYVDDQGYSYLTNDGITTQNNHLKGTFLNMYKGKALDDKGNIYHALTLTKESVLKDNLVLEAQPTPLYTFHADGAQIQTFDGFTYLANQTEREGDIYVKNGKLSYLDVNLPAVKDGIIIDDINGKHIETVLTQDGKLLNLGDALPLPSGFENNNIKYITDNMNHESGVIIVVYKDGANLIYNYKTNTILHNEDAPIAKTSFMDYLRSSFSLQMFLKAPSLTDKYEDTQHTVQALMADPALDETLLATSKDLEVDTKDSASITDNHGKVDKHDVQSDKNTEVNPIAKDDKSSDTREKKDGHTSGQTEDKTSVIKPQLLAVYEPKQNDYVIYKSQDLLNPAAKDVKSIEDLAQHNAELNNLLANKAIRTKKSSINNNTIIILLIVTLIGGCLIYIVRQRKAVRVK